MAVLSPTTPMEWFSSGQQQRGLALSVPITAAPCNDQFWCPNKLFLPWQKAQCANDSLWLKDQHWTQFLIPDGFRWPNYCQGCYLTYPPSIWQHGQEDIGLKSQLLHKVRKTHSLLCVADITLCCWVWWFYQNISHGGNLLSAHPSDLTAKSAFVCFAFLWYSFWLCLGMVGLLTFWSSLIMF